MLAHMTLRQESEKRRKRDKEKRPERNA